MEFPIVFFGPSGPFRGLFLACFPQDRMEMALILAGEMANLSRAEEKSRRTRSVVANTESPFRGKSAAA